MVLLKRSRAATIERILIKSDPVPDFSPHAAVLSFTCWRVVFEWCSVTAILNPGRSRREGKPLNDLTKNILLWVVIVMVMVVVFSRYVPTGTEPTQVSYSTVLDDVRNGRVESVTLRGDEILGVRKDKTRSRPTTPKPTTPR